MGCIGKIYSMERVVKGTLRARSMDRKSTICRQGRVQDNTNSQKLNNALYLEDAIPIRRKGVGSRRVAWEAGMRRGFARTSRERN